MSPDRTVKAAHFFLQYCWFSWQIHCGWYQCTIHDKRQTPFNLQPQQTWRGIFLNHWPDSLTFLHVRHKCVLLHSSRKYTTTCTHTHTQTLTESSQGNLPQFKLDSRDSRKHKATSRPGITHNTSSVKRSERLEMLQISVILFCLDIGDPTGVSFLQLNTTIIMKHLNNSSLYFQKSIPKMRLNNSSYWPSRFISRKLDFKTKISLIYVDLSSNEMHPRWNQFIAVIH